MPEQPACLGEAWPCQHQDCECDWMASTHVRPLRKQASHHCCCCGSALAALHAGRAARHASQQVSARAPHTPGQQVCDNQPMSPVVQRGGPIDSQPAHGRLLVSAQGCETPVGQIILLANLTPRHNDSSLTDWEAYGHCQKLRLAPGCTDGWGRRWAGEAALGSTRLQVLR